MADENTLKILTDEIDEEILSRMPLWFRILRDNYGKVNKHPCLKNYHS